MRKLISIIVMAGFLMVIFPLAAMAGAQEVVSLGADLTPQQEREILDFFGVDKNDVKIIKVTNQEMRQYLSGLVPEKQLGTTAYSSAHITLVSKGHGISVKTYNIAWVTKEMYANVMVTAGIEDADVVVTAPFQVSGASALTGITKAFEQASGKKLDEDAKKTANEELVVTIDLGEEIGQEQAADFMRDVKEEVVKKKVKNPDDIIEVIKRIADEHNIELTDAQIQRIMELMQKISRLDLNLNKISKQLENINKSVDDIKKAVKDNQGILEKIANSLQNFFNWIKDKIRGQA
ncbi:DUF1002 domain-containing protein [Syntrophaceticus schinkii]|jgi:uncharacterized protein YpuA (DUF1002 family)|uniref:DUF1002 domain-containing protein n=1 Tax=Syntrophaceticus schinkii TaxID=499207 RepID=A0A0B7MRR1_9FIRM|nr:DUF1002 domain-containing protein [Syntrophaceticus schinkii]CEO90352.1 conserved exported hypothetical protein [Syntrophaceticus schinkii]